MRFFAVSFLSKRLTPWSVAWENRYIRYMRLHPVWSSYIPNKWRLFTPFRKARSHPSGNGIYLFRKRSCNSSFYETHLWQASNESPDWPEWRPTFSESCTLTKPPSPTQAGHSLQDTAEESFPWKRLDVELFLKTGPGSKPSHFKLWWGKNKTEP